MKNNITQNEIRKELGLPEVNQHVQPNKILSLRKVKEKKKRKEQKKSRKLNRK